MRAQGPHSELNVRPNSSHPPGGARVSGRASALMGCRAQPGASHRLSLPRQLHLLTTQRQRSRKGPAGRPKCGLIVSTLNHHQLLKELLGGRVRVTRGQGLCVVPVSMRTSAEHDHLQVAQVASTTHAHDQCARQTRSTADTFRKNARVVGGGSVYLDTRRWFAGNLGLLRASTHAVYVADVCREPRGSVLCSLSSRGRHTQTRAQRPQTHMLPRMYRTTATVERGR